MTGFAKSFAHRAPAGIPWQVRERIAGRSPPANGPRAGAPPTHATSA
ncbi:hypothetical protein BPA30113_02076 [Burkholderia paludis]|uniref:Uncharacterized protein n=2 Tax=Burkholderia paludis TaxID=1506587 RepID=A0A6J5DG55_9BURK|nr:hypothetical protein LMG30113_01694 [Burkholderia paludis]VWB48513.1 hypothetical protein BPA30113_02076 [Burkholderia paludis]